MIERLAQPRLIDEVGAIHHPSAQRLSLDAHDGRQADPRRVKEPLGKGPSRIAQVPQEVDEGAPFLQVVGLHVVPVRHLRVQVVMVVSVPRREHAVRVLGPYALKRKRRVCAARRAREQVVRKIPLVLVQLVGQIERARGPEPRPPAFVFGSALFKAGGRRATRFVLGRFEPVITVGVGRNHVGEVQSAVAFLLRQHDRPFEFFTRPLAQPRDPAVFALLSGWIPQFRARPSAKARAVMIAGDRLKEPRS